MNIEPGEQAEQAIADWSNTSVPLDVDLKLRADLEHFRQSLADLVLAQKRVSQPYYFRLAVGSLATIPIVVLLMLAYAVFLRGEDLAAVATAIGSQEWIQAEIETSEKEHVKIWYSRSEDISAWVSEDRIEFNDHRLRIYEQFDIEAQELFRRGEYQASKEPAQQQMARLLPSFLALTTSVHDELAAGKTSALQQTLPPGMSVVNKSQKTESENGIEWQVHEFELQGEGRPQLTHVTIRVDPQNHLPVAYEVNGEVNFHADLKYFQGGPASIYKLGVPAGVKVTNQIPTDDLERILRTLRYGATRMDDYRAVAVVDSGNTTQQYLNQVPTVMYRKGYKFRTSDDFLTTPQVVTQAGPTPAIGADVRQWWENRALQFKDYPMYLTADGYNVLIHTESQRNGGARELKPIVTRMDGIRPAPDLPASELVPHHPRLPEYVCRPADTVPSLGLGNQWYDQKLIPKPNEGPNGCVLIQSLRKPITAGTDYAFLPAKYLVWVDPGKDFAVKQWESFDDQGKVIHRTIIEEFAQSPNGVWYAKKFAQPIVSNGTSTFTGYNYEFFVDFNFPVPDSLFRIPAVGDTMEPFKMAH